MNSDLQELNNIMKPYFDKKQEIEQRRESKQNAIAQSKTRLNELRQERLTKKTELEINLAQLKQRYDRQVSDFEEKKEREITEYLDDPRYGGANIYYRGYLRNDLENEYNKRLEQISKDYAEKRANLEKEIKALRYKSAAEKEEDIKYSSFKNEPDFMVIDLRELADAKDETRKGLLKYKRIIENKIAEEKLTFDTIMFKMRTFEHKYDENRNVLNGNDYAKLFKESNDSIDRSNKLKEILSKINEYLEQVNYTNEEITARMRSLTSIEEQEYARRASVREAQARAIEEETRRAVEENHEEENQVEEKHGEDDKSNPTSTPIKGTEDNKKTRKPRKPKENSDMIQTDDVVYTPESNYEDDDEISVATRRDMLTLIYNEIVDGIGLDTVRLNPSKQLLPEGEYYISTKAADDEKFKTLTSALNTYDDNRDIQLPNGEYVNVNDFASALDVYHKKYKNLTYVVKETGKKYTIPARKIRKFRSVLEKCSALKLVKDEVIAKDAVMKVYGKSYKDEFYSDNSLADIKSNVKEGTYIDKKELVLSLQKLFRTRRLEWLRKLSKKIKESFTVEESEEEIADRLNENEADYTVRHPRDNEEQVVENTHYKK